eukprot:1144025-Pelagomonas_calceolata.AAC.4
MQRSVPKAFTCNKETTAKCTLRCTMVQQSMLQAVPCCTRNLQQVRLTCWSPTHNVHEIPLPPYRHCGWQCTPVHLLRCLLSPCSTPQKGEIIAGPMHEAKQTQPGGIKMTTCTQQVANR